MSERGKRYGEHRGKMPRMRVQHRACSSVVDSVVREGLLDAMTCARGRRGVGEGVSVGI